MTRYYFDTYDGSTWCTDDEGQEQPTKQQALKLAYEALGDLAKDEVPKGQDGSLLVRLRRGDGSRVEVSLELRTRWPE
jgi:hypothetical protein